jgi:PAS domain S-box-containing protein
MKKSKTFTITTVLVAGSIALAALVVYVERNTISTYEKNLPYLTVGEYLKNLSTKAHLWFEEAMAGDQSISVEKDVYAKLNKCIETLNGAKEGKETELGHFYKSEDLETIDILNESIADVENLLASANKRWAFKQERDAAKNDSTQIAEGEEAGGKLDQEFDAAYEELQTTFERLVAHVDKRVKADSSFLNSLSWISIVLITLALGALCYFIYRILRGNDKLTSENKSRLAEEADRVTTLTNFLETVSSGKFDMELDSSNELNNRLLSIRNKLRDGMIEEKKRNWSTTGSAQIGAILQSNFTSSTELYDEVIRFVVKYTNSNQGGLFLLNEGTKEKEMSLVACYAYERKKFLDKQVAAGEGLVGQCFLEQEMIYMTAVPKSYVSITSGLGQATPTAIILIPLKVNDSIVGVMELASFTPYETHERELLQKFAESVASTVSTVRINERTKQLLEQSQQQAEEMKAQEEEMRQNMEELTATQEEMKRKESEMVGQLEAINNSQAFIEFDVEGNIIEANDIFLKTMKYSLSELKGKHHRIFVDSGYAVSQEYREFWRSFNEGKSRSGEFLRKAKDGSLVWLSANYTPVINSQGKVMKVIKLARDISKEKQLLEQSQQQTEEMKAQEEEMRQNMEELSAMQEDMGRKEKEYLRRIEELENHKMVA